MSNAIAGPGFLTKYSAHGASSYTTVSEVKDITGPEQISDTVDVTNQSSPNRYKEYVPTLLDGGVYSFPLNYNPSDATQQAILAALQAQTLTDWELVIGNTGKAFFWSGYVKKFGGKFPVANVAEISCEIQITGPVTGPSAAI